MLYVKMQHSYADGDYSRDFGNAMRELDLERLYVLLGNEGIYKADKGEMNFVLLCVGQTMDPDEVKFHKAQDDWVDPSPNTAKGQPTIEKVDNPDG